MNTATKSSHASIPSEVLSLPPAFLARKIHCFPEFVIVDLVGDPEEFRSRYRKVRNDEVEILLAQQCFFLTIRREVFIAIPFSLFEAFTQAKRAFLCVSELADYSSEWVFTLELDRSTLLRAEGAWRYRQAPAEE